MDTVPPRLLASWPANGDTNVETDGLVIEFSERLDESSASRAVVAAPAFDAPLQIRARGRELEIQFPDTLQAQTTYVISLGTELRDEHGVALQRPITMAFATGNVLDRGRIEGRLINPTSNSGTGGFQLFAYRLPAAFGEINSLNIPHDSVHALFNGEDAAYELPDPRSDAPTYSSEAAGDGSFQLDYMREGPYFVIALEDLNRNRRADDGERFAVPEWPLQNAIADSLAQSEKEPFELFVASVDTTAPQLRRARSVSNQRFILSFDESVALTSLSTADWSMVDSASGEAARISSVYQRPGQPSEVLFQTDAALPPNTYSFFVSNAVADSIGNAANFVGAVRPSSSADTVSVRFENFLPRAAHCDSVFSLRPDRFSGVQFNQPIDSLTFREWVVTIGPNGEIPYSYESRRGVSYNLVLNSPPRTFRVEVRMPDSTYVRRYAIPAADALGSISGRVEGQHGASVLIEARLESGEPFFGELQTDATFIVRQLPPGSYRLRLFVDRNGNGRWDGGSLAPYLPPEPLQWLTEPIQVRARWEHEVEDAVDFGND